MAELAMRADISERTLMRMEKGDPAVGIGNLASVLSALGSPTVLTDIMSPENDAVGLARALQSVPKRGRSFTPNRPNTSIDEMRNDQSDTGSKLRERKGLGF